MTEFSFLNRKLLLFKCNLVYETVDIRYLPRRFAFLIFIAVYCLTTQRELTYTLTLIAWGILALVIRPQTAQSLEGINLAKYATNLRIRNRWFVAIVCVIFTWFASSNVLWNAWNLLLIVFIFDFIMSIFGEFFHYSKIQHEINLLKKLPEDFHWEDVKSLQDQLPITYTHYPKSPDQKLEQLQGIKLPIPIGKNGQWFYRFTQLPPNQVWTTYKAIDLHTLPDKSCVFAVFDQIGITLAVGNSHWQKRLGAWKESIISISSKQPVQIKVAWLSDDDDLNAACWWLDQTLKPYFLLFDPSTVPEHKKLVEDLGDLLSKHKQRKKQKMELMNRNPHRHS